jgi:hypothetical protein
METPKKCHKLTLPSPHILPMQYYVLNVSGALLINAGRNCKGLGYGKGKDAAAKRQVRVIKTWIYSWMCRGVLFQEEYEM